MKQRYWLRFFGIAALGMATLMSAALQAQQSARDLFEGARIMEGGGQDTREVIRLYEQAGAAAKSDPALAAESYLRSAYAYEKLGMLKEANAAFERVAGGYKETSQAAEASRQLERLRAKTPKPLTPRLVCSALQGGCGFGSAESASISQDGSSMAISDDGLVSDLAIRDLVTGQVMRTLGARNGWLDAAGMVSASNPVFSQDGRQVAFTVMGHLLHPNDSGLRGQNLQNAIETIPALRRQVELIESLTHQSPGVDAHDVLRIIPNEVAGKPRTLINNPEYRRVTAVAWSSDDKSILVTIAKPDETWQLAWVSVADGAVKPIKSLGWRFMDGENGMGRPSLSPDGRRIAYAALADNPDSPPSSWGRGGRGRGGRGGGQNGYRHIYVLTLNADGSGSEVAVAKGASISHSPVWTADGKNILFISNRSGNFGLWSVAVTDGRESADPVSVKPDLGSVAVVGMTRSGSYYYEQTQKALNWVVIGTLDGSKPNAKNTKPKSLLGNQPSWAPDGKRVAFLRSKSGETVPGCQNCADTLLVYSLDTGGEKGYATPAGLRLVGMPLWLHDGKALLQMMRDAGGQQSLYRVDLKTGEFRQIVSAAITRPWALSSDGKTLYQGSMESTAQPVVVKRFTVTAIDLNSGEQRLVSTVPGAVGPQAIVLSPDDQTLYLKMCESVEQDSRSDVSTDTYDPGVAARTCSRIVAVDVKTGRQRPVLTLAKSQGIEDSRFALSPDGGRLAVVVRKASNGDQPRTPGTIGASDTDLNRRLNDALNDIGALMNPAAIDYRLITIGADGTDLRTLYEFSAAPLMGGVRFGAGQLFWSPDGGSITLRNSPRQLIRVPVNGSRPEVLASSLEDIPNSVISPHGAHIALTIGQGVREMWALDSITTFVKAAR